MRTRYLVAYDIRNDARLRKINKVVKAYGYSLQYSVFVCDLTKSERTHMYEELRDAINTAVDSVVVIDLGPADARGSECFEFMGSREPLPSTSAATII